MSNILTLVRGRVVAPENTKESTSSRLERKPTFTISKGLSVDNKPGSFVLNRGTSVDNKPGEFKINTGESKENAYLPEYNK